MSLILLSTQSKNGPCHQVGEGGNEEDGEEEGEDGEEEEEDGEEEEKDGEEEMIPYQSARSLVKDNLKVM